MQPPSGLEKEAECVPVPDQASVFLRYARIADSHSDGLERELKNILQCAERGRHRDAGLARLSWREKRDRGRRIRPLEAPPAIVLPVRPEARRVRAVLPRQGVVEMESAAEIVGNGTAPSDIHHVLGEQDGGRADAQAPRTVL